MRAFRKTCKWTEPFHQMTNLEKLEYTGHHHGMLHALVSCLGAVYGFVYADGVEGTTWFHCNYYKLHMFDVQKYLNMLTAGYFCFDILFVLAV